MTTAIQGIAPTKTSIACARGEASDTQTKASFAPIRDHAPPLSHEGCGGTTLAKRRSTKLYAPYERKNGIPKRASSAARRVACLYHGVRAARARASVRGACQACSLAR